MSYQSQVNSEDALSFRIAEYLRTYHPGVLFHWDYGSGLKMTMGQAVRQKRLNKRSWPDLFIAQPAYLDEGGTLTGELCYHGLFIELKREGTRLKKANGMYANEHVTEQAMTLELLQDAGYIAQFAVGYEAATEIIDSYLAGYARAVEDAA